MEDLKPWQKGIPLDELLQHQQTWDAFNAACFSPFLEVKKNKIAAAIDALNYLPGEDFALISRESKTRTSISMFSGCDVPLCCIEKGDRVVQAFATTSDHGVTGVVDALKIFASSSSTWLFVNEGDDTQKTIAAASGFTKVGVKINTFSDIVGVYFNGYCQPMTTPDDLWCIEQTTLDFARAAAAMAAKLSLCEFTDHYSNYNDSHAWGAVSLRGYTSDPAFITKPAEMSSRWQMEHEDESFELQDTPLRKVFKQEVDDVLCQIGGVPHRIRLMRLTPGGGTLQRHTDQVDKDTGVRDRELMRFHIPLVTNPGVEFTSWDVDAAARVRHMEHGECWYLDTRKPHRAVNDGDAARVHLVLDIEASPDVRRHVENVTTV